MSPNPHAHDYLTADIGDESGRGADIAVIGRFIGAGIDGCRACQDETLDRIARHSPSTARLVELACIAVAEQTALYVAEKAAGLPRTERGVPGFATDEFRSLARTAGAERSDELYAACAALNDDQRRAAADRAGDLLVGIMSLPAPETPA